MSLPSEAVGIQLESDLPEVRDVSKLMETVETTANVVALVDPENLVSILLNFFVPSEASFRCSILR